MKQKLEAKEAARIKALSQNNSENNTPTNNNNNNNNNVFTNKSSAWTPFTTRTDYTDPDNQVERLEGEFDSSTGTKIGNFFSRDAEYILELIEEDDVLIDVLLELLLIATALHKSKSRLAKGIR